MYFSCIDGQIRLIVRDLSADDSQNSLDRFTLTYSEGFMNSVGISSDMFLTTTGLGSDFLPKVDLSGKEVPYTIIADEPESLRSGCWKYLCCNNTFERLINQ